MTTPRTLSPFALVALLTPLAPAQLQNLGAYRARDFEVSTVSRDGAVVPDYSQGAVSGAGVGVRTEAIEVRVLDPTLNVPYYASDMSTDGPGAPNNTGGFAATFAQSLYFQAWYRDANPAPTSNSTSAASVRFH